VPEPSTRAHHTGLRWTRAEPLCDRAV